MVSFSSVATFGLLALASAGAAPQVSDSPTDTLYKATFNKTISGSVSFSSKNGSTLIGVNISNLPSTGGPFMYHIHEKPVPTNGSCAGTLGHFNPYNGTVGAATPALHEVGDLSGKHGTINGTSIQTSYIDQYVSLNPTDKAFINGLSVVVHFANSSRLACANITKDAVVVSSGAAQVAGSVAAGLPLAAGVVALLI
ncbi:hypothetical protein JCM33374_g3500 [Metschnikowia sp. JCM 33374]|nr:hypothetical protein JCM33374_g3500 [Metschnikowia sp. JCM 33374]